METILNKINTQITSYNASVKAKSIAPGAKDEISETLRSLNEKVRDTLIDSLLIKRDGSETTLTDFYSDFLNNMKFEGYAVKEDKDTHELSLERKTLMLSVSHVEKRMNADRKEAAKKTGEQFFAISMAQKPTFHHHAVWFYDCLYALNTSSDSGVNAAKVALKDEFLSETAIAARAEAGFSKDKISKNKAVPMLKAILDEFFGEYLTLTEVKSTDINFLLLSLQRLKLDTLTAINEKTFVDCLMIVAEHRLNNRPYEFTTRHSAYKKA